MHEHLEAFRKPGIHILQRLIKVLDEQPGRRSPFLWGKPAASLEVLFGITVDTTNLTHILRAVMGLYFGMVVIWLWGAFDKSLTEPALVCCAVFMLGLAVGRLWSFPLCWTASRMGY
jgi:hypothetical protein